MLTNHSFMSSKIATSGLSKTNSNFSAMEWRLDEPPSTALTVDEIDHVNNPHPRCPVAVLLDTSGSMQGAPIVELQRGLLQFMKELSADELAALRIELALYTVGGTVGQPMSFGMPLDATEAQRLLLAAGGETPLGVAVRRAVEDVRQRQKIYRQSAISAFRPWVVMMSDGEPNDAGWESAAAELRALATNQKWNVFCVAIGDHANVSKLQQFSPSAVQRLAGLKFAELFRWLSDSLKTVSRSSTSDKTQALPSTRDWSFTP